MSTEARGDGELSMLLVGNIGVNRVLADCLDIKNIRMLEQMVYQNSAGFEATIENLAIAKPFGDYT